MSSVEGMISMLAVKNIEISTDKPVQSDSAGTIEFGPSLINDELYWDAENLSGFVYGEKATISNYVNAYKNTLTDIGLSNDINVSLISLAQLSSPELGCPSMGFGLCTGPTWVYDREYWSGTLSYGVNMHGIDIPTEEWQEWHIYDSINAVSSPSGIRPVVILDEIEIAK